MLVSCGPVDPHGMLLKCNIFFFTDFVKTSCCFLYHDILTYWFFKIANMAFWYVFACHV